MALNARKSRAITVDGVDYRWSVGALWDESFGIVVQLADGTGQKLVSQVDRSKVIPPPGQEFDRGKPVTPRLVRSHILAARDEGWKPDRPGAEFRRIVEAPPLMGDEPVG